MNNEVFEKIRKAAKVDTFDCGSRCYDFNLIESTLHPDKLFVRYTKSHFNSVTGEPEAHHKYLAFDRVGNEIAFNFDTTIKERNALYLSMKIIQKFTI